MTLNLDLTELTYTPIKLSNELESYAFSSERETFSRSVSLSFSYRFGNKKVKSARRKTNSEIDERLK